MEGAIQSVNMLQLKRNSCGSSQRFRSGQGLLQGMNLVIRSSSQEFVQWNVFLQFVGKTSFLCRIFINFMAKEEFCEQKFLFLSCAVDSVVCSCLSQFVHRSCRNYVANIWHCLHSIALKCPSCTRAYHGLLIVLV